jgi:hypothetical protein
MCSIYCRWFVSNKAPFGSLGTGRSRTKNLPRLYKIVKGLCGWESFACNLTGPKDMLEQMHDQQRRLTKRRVSKKNDRTYNMHD